METQTVLEKYHAAEAFDMSVVLDRYQQESRLPTPVVLEHEREIKRFLSMCAANPGSYGMRGPLDQLWHTFIIFTEKYGNFCDKVAGQFIHHFPIIHHDEANIQEAPNKTYLNFLIDYKKFFGEDPSPEFWPRPLPGIMWPGCNECGAACGHKCYA